MSEPEDVIARPLAEVTAAHAAAAMEHCFEGYIVPVRMTPESWERRFRGEHLDPFASRIYERDGQAGRGALHLPARMDEPRGRDGRRGGCARPRAWAAG